MYKDKYHLEVEGARFRVVSNRSFLCHGIQIGIGTKGGLVDGFDNLSQDGKCWVFPNAIVQGNAVIKDDACVKGHAIVSNNAVICQNASIENDCQVSGNAFIRGNARLEGSIWVTGKQVIGRDLADGNYYEKRGQYMCLIRDCHLTYNVNLKKLSVEDYVGRAIAGSCALGVRIISGFDLEKLTVKRDGENGIVLHPNTKVIEYAIIGL